MEILHRRSGLAIERPDRQCRQRDHLPAHYRSDRSHRQQCDVSEYAIDCRHFAKRGVGLHHGPAGRVWHQCGRLYQRTDRRLVEHPIARLAFGRLCGTDPRGARWLWHRHPGRTAHGRCRGTRVQCRPVEHSAGARSGRLGPQCAGHQHQPAAYRRLAKSEQRGDHCAAVSRNCKPRHQCHRIERGTDRAAQFNAAVGLRRNRSGRIQQLSGGCACQWRRGRDEHHANRQFWQQCGWTGQRRYPGAQCHSASGIGRRRAGGTGKRRHWQRGKRRVCLVQSVAGGCTGQQRGRSWCQRHHRPGPAGGEPEFERDCRAPND